MLNKNTEEEDNTEEEKSEDGFNEMSEPVY